MGSSPRRAKLGSRNREDRLQVITSGNGDVLYSTYSASSCTVPGKKRWEGKSRIWGGFYARA